MPYYDFECKKCRNKFTQVMKIKEREEKKRLRCPVCKSQSVKPIYASFTAITSKKS